MNKKQERGKEYERKAKSHHCEEFYSEETCPAKPWRSLISGKLGAKIAAFRLHSTRNDVALFR